MMNPNPPPLPPTSAAATLARRPASTAPFALNIWRLLAVMGIFACTCVGWVLLGASLTVRTGGRDNSLRESVAGSWGPEMEQPHPVVYYTAPAARRQPGRGPAGLRA